jgi:hypothetical protein
MHLHLSASHCYRHYLGHWISKHGHGKQLVGGISFLEPTSLIPDILLWVSGRMLRDGGVSTSRDAHLDLGANRRVLVSVDEGNYQQARAEALTASLNQGPALNST